LLDIQDSFDLVQRLQDNSRHSKYEPGKSKSLRTEDSEENDDLGHFPVQKEEGLQVLDDFVQRGPKENLPDFDGKVCGPKRF
tara:strand:- start:3930 stop:4175 length:246 start_codon:yes stop_codon:yes gene_type:complete